MVVLQAKPVLLVALVVWALWRVVLWRRRSVANVSREVAVALTFLWSLVIVRVTFFPLTIIFYDWHGASNVTPFASIIQLVRETPPVFAFENIAGNLVLFAPLGVLLPLLFSQLKGPLALAWRAGAISVLIEGTQFLTRARSVDIDDVILNTTGALIGLGVFTLAAGLVTRAPSGRRLLTKLSSATAREPLFTAAVPFLVTAAIAVPMLLTTVVGQTIGGADGIEAVALAGFDDAQIAARGEVGDHTFLVATDDMTARGQLELFEFKRVMPSRYTPLSRSEIEPVADSTYRSHITAFNPTAGEEPILVLWGSNAGAATAVHVTGNGLDATLRIEPGPAFVTGVTFAYDETVGILDDFEFTFTTVDGVILSGFRPANG